MNFYKKYLTSLTILSGLLVFLFSNSSYGNQELSKLSSSLSLSKSASETFHHADLILAAEDFEEESEGFEVDRIFWGFVFDKSVVLFDETSLIPSTFLSDFSGQLQILNIPPPVLA